MSEKSKSLVGGISILGLAGLICKVVGVLYRIPLADYIGGEGLGIYSKVFTAYNVLLTVSSAGIPVAISRMVPTISPGRIPATPDGSLAWRRPPWRCWASSARCCCCWAAGI